MIIDLDPQCNMTLLSLGEDYYEDTASAIPKKDIFTVLSGIIRGGADIDVTVPFIEL